MAKEITTKEIYDLIDKKMGDLDKNLGGRIEKLTDAFMKLEEGRVSTLEREMAQVVANLTPIKSLVYGMVALILTIVISSIVYLVVKGQVL